MLASADAVTIVYVADEDAAIADFACMCDFKDGIYGRFDNNLAANDTDGYALNDIRVVAYTTIDALLA